MVFNTLYNIVDVYFAGQLNTASQAGLAIGFQAFYFLMAVGFGLSAAMGTLIGNALGEKENARACRFTAQGICYALIISVILMGIGVWFGPLMISWVSEPGVYRDAGTGYFTWLLFALPGFLLAYVCNGILQAQGDSVSLQHALMVAFFANIGLNPLLIYGIPGIWSGMGFNGIALSTVLSQTGVMVFMVFRVLRSKTGTGATLRYFKPLASDFRQITRQMLPVSISMQVMFLAGFVVQYSLKGFGDHALAGHGVALRLEQLLLLPVLGLTGALLPIAAQNFGAKKFDRVREAVLYCWKVGFILTLLAYPIIWFGAESAMRLFTDDPEVVRVGVSYLKVDGLILPVYMMLFAINSFLQALKRPAWILWIGIFRQGFGVAFFIWVFIRLFEFDVVGVWFGVATSVIFGWLLSLFVANREAKREIGGLWRPSGQNFFAKRRL